MWPNLMILGGGVSKSADKFIPRLIVNCEIVPASLRNDAGIIGAAVVAAEGPRRGDRRRIDRDPTSAKHPRGEDMTSDEQATMERTSDEEPIRAQMVIGGESVDAADGQTFDVVNPATGKVIATVPLGGPADVDRAVEAARRAFDDRKGWATWAAGKRGRTLAKFASLIKANTEALAQLESRNVGKPITSARGEITGVSLVFDYYAGAANKIFGADDPGLEAGARPDAARADRRGRADRALELPVVDGIVEGGARAGRREHGDPQARQLLPVDRDPARRAGTRGGDPARRPQRRDRAGWLGRRGDRRASGDRQGRVHRRDDDRPGDHAAGRRQREEDLARARWQEPEHRLRRRGPREVRARVAVLGLRQRRPGLLRAEPDPRRALGPRPGRRAVRGRDADRQARRSVARRDRGRDAGQLQAARPGRATTSRSAWPRAPRSSSAARRRPMRRWPMAPT